MGCFLLLLHLPQDLAPGDSPLHRPVLIREPFPSNRRDHPGGMQVSRDVAVNG